MNLRFRKGRLPGGDRISMKRYEAVVVGVSSGRVGGLEDISFPPCRPIFPLPCSMVYHQGPRRDGFVIEYLNTLTEMEVREAEEKGELSGPGWSILPRPTITSWWRRTGP